MDPAALSWSLCIKQTEVGRRCSTSNGFSLHPPNSPPAASPPHTRTRPSQALIASRSKELAVQRERQRGAEEALQGELEKQARALDLRMRSSRRPHPPHVGPLSSV
jgi:hypothetical protein